MILMPIQVLSLMEEKIYAIVEAGGYPVEIDQDLNSLNTKPFYGNSNEGFTAHPKIDPDTNEMHAMCYDYANNFDTVNYVVIDQNGSHRKLNPYLLNLGR